MKNVITIDKGLGDFLLRSPIQAYLDHYSFNLTRAETEMDYDDYALADNPLISLWVDDGIIESIRCQDECWLDGKNIMGMLMEEFAAFFEQEPDGPAQELNFEEDGIPQYVYDYNAPDLQVWVKQGRIVTVIISYFDD